MEQRTTLDQFSDFVFGAFDKVSKGVATYFDGAIAFNEAQNALNQARNQNDNFGTIQDLSTGSAASTHGDPDGVLDFKINSSQGILVVAGLGLAVFAIARS